MDLSRIGQTLSHYRLTAPIGAGGMGEVYRAIDTALGREVAIKVLPANFARDAERLARFKREAHLLASLNHPNIAAIYDLEDADATLFLVLELIEGEDLSVRLARGPVPLTEALEIARQVAEALEAAHDRGIVHRDLKPANIKVTPAGVVKVLDFGLAKAWAGDPSSGNVALSPSMSPTIGLSHTAAGMILGTAGYMSPEQARGRPVDKRSDVWAFGVVLYELLTGRSLFGGETVTDIIAAVLRAEPDMSALPFDTPSSVRRLLRRCLQRDPRMRLPDIGAARLELSEALAGDVDAAVPSPQVSVAARPRWLAPALAGVALMVALAAAGLLYGAGRSAPIPAPPPLRFALDLPEGVAMPEGQPPLVSPDGRYIAVVNERELVSDAIWLRESDGSDFRRIPGTAGAREAFWSADSSSLGFATAGQLRALTVKGGGVRTICTLASEIMIGATWNRQGVILFSLAPQDTGPENAVLFTVPADGGEPTRLTGLLKDRGEGGHYWPRFLPDGRRFLFAVFRQSLRQADLYVSSLDAADERHRLLDSYSTASLVGDRLLYVTQGNTLMAQRLDLRGMRLEGEAQAIADGVQVWTVANRALFSASDSGIIVYVPGRPPDPDLQLTWMDRAGVVRRKVGEPARYGQIALSPDEKQVAVEIEMGEPPDHWDVWTFDVARGVPSRVTFGPPNYRDPVWSPDGRELAYGLQKPNDIADLYRKSVGGTREEVPLVQDQTSKYPEQWLPGGLVYLTGLTSKDRRVWLRPITDNAPAQPLLGRGGFFIDEPQVSPDGRWVAYLSDESGRREVYVEPFRRAGRRVRVSPDGGGQPKWRGDGRELYYVNANGKLMAVSVQAGEELTVGLPQPLFDIKPFQPDQDDYAVSSNGQQFLVKVPVDTAQRGRVQVVVSSPALHGR